MQATRKSTSSSPMTRKEFVKVKLAIEQEQFQPSDLGPLTYGIQRASFERTKLEKLVAAAEQVEGKTARAQVERWKRKIHKIHQSQINLEKLREEIAAPVPGVLAQKPMLQQMQT